MQNVNRMKAICIVVDVLGLIYGGLYYFWMVFSVGTTGYHGLDHFFTTINPMTYGTYFLGIVLLFHCYVFKNIWGRLVFWILYLFSAIVSLIAIMGMDIWSDFLIYAPHLIIIPAAVYIMYRGRRRA